MVESHNQDFRKPYIKSHTRQWLSDQLSDGDPFPDPTHAPGGRGGVGAASFCYDIRYGVVAI